VYAASRGVLEMIEILKVKREFLYLLLTLTQEKNVKVARFPLIYLDETILAHTNLAEFRKFLQESENEGLLDRMVIVQVPYTLNYKEEARIYRKLILSAPAFRDVHLDPHVRHAAAVFAVLSRLHEGEEREADLAKRVRIHGGEDVDGVHHAEALRVRNKEKSPDEGLSGVSPRFVINGLSQAIIHSARNSISTMDLLLALKDAIERRPHRVLAQAALDRLPGPHAQGVLQPLGQGRRAQGAVHLLRTRGGRPARQIPRRSGGHARQPAGARPDHQRGAPPGRALPARGRGKIHISDSGKQSFRQEVVRKAMSAYKRGERFGLGSHAQLRDALQHYLFEQRRDVLRLVSSSKRPDDEVRQDFRRRAAAGGRLRLRQPLCARSAELRHHAAGTGVICATTGTTCSRAARATGCATTTRCARRYCSICPKRCARPT
jgi:serine protein kinase